MIRALFIWLSALAIGAGLVAFLPEQGLGGGDLFRLSARHGPSLVDGVGLVVVLAGWLYFLRALWMRRSQLQPRALAFALVAATLLAAAACVFAFTSDRDGAGSALAVLAVAAQIGLALLARRA